MSDYEYGSEEDENAGWSEEEGSDNEDQIEILIQNTMYEADEARTKTPQESIEKY